MLGLGSMPLYFLPSGLPQLAHLLFLIFALCCLSWLAPLRWNNRVHWLLGALCGYIFTRQCFFVMTGGVQEALTPIFYILYNILIFAAVYRYLAEYPLNALHAGVLISVIVALLGVALYGFSFVAVEGEPYRTVGTFNNPNQLGYYALCLTGIAAIGYLRDGIPRISLIIVFLGCAFLTVMSLSKAAMIGTLFYVLIFFRWREVRGIIPVFVAILVVVCLIVVYMDTDMENLKFIQRLGAIGSDTDDNMVSRGYGALLDPDMRIIYGYGEGYVRNIIGHETHSTLGNILISYGLFGFILIASILFFVFARSVKRFGLIVTIGLLAPSMLYGITHNGFRFTIFWIYLAAAYSAGSATVMMKDRMLKARFRPVQRYLPNLWTGS